MRQEAACRRLPVSMGMTKHDLTCRMTRHPRGGCLQRVGLAHESVRAALRSTRHPVDFALGLGRVTVEIRARVIALAYGGLEFDLQIADRRAQVVAPLRSCLGQRRISEVSAIFNAGAIFFRLDLTIELGCHVLEFADHKFDVRYFAPLLFTLETLEAEARLP